VDYLLGFLNVVIVILTLFLIVLILIQRGRGGGLAGAFGGMGGSSAFGARTGDVFTKVTVGVAIAWILLSMFMVVLTNRKPKSDWADERAAVTTDSGRDSKTRSKGTGAGTGAKGSTTPAELPDALDNRLSSDLKALTDLPDPIETPPVTPKKK
jgi:preprotein translocase subunit SecG